MSHEFCINTTYNCNPLQGYADPGALQRLSPLARVSLVCPGLRSTTVKRIAPADLPYALVRITRCCVSTQARSTNTAN